MLLIQITSIALLGNALSATLFVADRTGSKIYSYDSLGNRNIFATSVNAASLAFDSSGSLYVGETSSQNIYKYATNGSRTKFATLSSGAPVNMAFNPTGELLVTDSGSNIVKYSSDGSSIIFDSGLRSANALAFDTSGNLYATDIGGIGYIYKYDTGGVRSTFTNGLVASSIAFDSLGNLFAANGRNIYKFAPNGSRTLFASNAAVVSFGMAIDSVGNVYESDSYSGNIYKFLPNGTKSVFDSGLNYPNMLVFQPPIVPEPSTYALFGLGASALAIAYCRKVS